MKRDGYEKDRRRLEADLQQCDADCCSLQVLLDSIKIKAQEASREGDASILKGEASRGDAQLELERLENRFEWFQEAKKSIL